MCTCEHVCMKGCTEYAHVKLGVWRLHVSIGCFPQSLPTLLFEPGSLIRTCALLFMLIWLANESQGSCGPPSMSIHHMPDFGLETEPKPSCLCDKSFMDWSTPDFANRHTAPNTKTVLITTTSTAFYQLHSPHNVKT